MSQALFNTIIGEGSGGGPSSAVSISIEARGSKGAVGNHTIFVQVMNGNRLTKKTFTLKKLDDEGRAEFEVRVHDTGYDPLAIQVSLNGKVVAKHDIPFECGE